MALSTSLKNALNRLLAPVNLRLDSLTAERLERERLDLLAAEGRLDAPLYDRLPPVDEAFLAELGELYARVHPYIERLETGVNDVNYEPDNGFFTTPDLQALYLMIRHFSPERIVEVGCGNSTRIARQAIMDGDLSTHIHCIDPMPRTEVSDFADEVTRCRLEEVTDDALVDELNPGDILFIDSSHEVRVGNDVVRAVCRLLPALEAGVVVHFHDIFLPYDYPPAFTAAFPDWGEQYLLYAWLLNNPVRMLWPGYLLQKERTDLREGLPFLGNGSAQSFWFRTRAKDWNGST